MTSSGSNDSMPKKSGGTNIAEIAFSVRKEVSEDLPNGSKMTPYHERNKWPKGENGRVRSGIKAQGIPIPLEKAPTELKTLETTKKTDPQLTEWSADIMATSNSKAHDSKEERSDEREYKKSLSANQGVTKFLRKRERMIEKDLRKEIGERVKMNASVASQKKHNKDTNGDGGFGRNNHAKGSRLAQALVSDQGGQDAAGQTYNTKAKTYKISGSSKELNMQSGSEISHTRKSISEGNYITALLGISKRHEAIGLDNGLVGVGGANDSQEEQELFQD